jgi:hypothetical protein
MDKLRGLGEGSTRRDFLTLGGLAAGAIVAASSGLLGCGGSAGYTIVGQRGEVFTPGAARVVLRGVRNDIISVDVFNMTAAPMVIYRDSFLLSTSSGMRARLPGGVSNVYTVPPGGVHEVRLRYDLHGLSRGEQIALVVQNALVVNAQPVPIEPLPFVVQ